MIAVLQGARDQLARLGGILADIGRELSELSLGGPRARVCAATALAVIATVVVASAWHMPDPWWAALSASRAVMATRPASFQRVVLRIAGTAAGAGAAIVLLPFMAYDPLACGLALAFFGFFAILGYSVSAHGYAWLFSGITFALVSLSSLQDPPLALSFAWLRLLEVALGCAVAGVVAWMLVPGGGKTERFPGWSDLLGSGFPAVVHALRGGIAIASVPFLWRWLELPGLAQMPITVAAVMAVPFAVIADPSGRDREVMSKSLLRVVGCVIGGLAGLAVLAFSPTDFVALLLLLGAGVWVATHVQASTRGVGYVGTQGSMAFLLTLVQRAGPPQSILPGLDRLAGILCGLAILIAVTTLLEIVSGPPRVAAKGVA